MAILNRVPLRTQVADLLRKEIKDHNKPGDRLQTEIEMTKRLKVSLITVKEALGILAHQGWIERRQGKGTFVTKPIDEPSTQLAKIALISGLELEYFQSSTYFLNILTKVRHILAERQLGSRLYLGLSDYSPDQAMPNSTVDFLDDLAGKMVTGVVATGFSAQKAILEELSARNIPIISTDEGFPQAVSTDSDNLIKEGIRELIKRGYRRIAIAKDPNTDDHAIKIARSSVRDSGFSEETIVPISYDTRNWTNEVNRQAMVEILSGDSRPDALMLLDDFQLPGVISAFNALGLRTPGDILICVWHNSGAKDPDISCMVMEVDTDAIAYGLCAQLDHLLAGRGVPQQTLVRGHLRLVGNI